MNIRGSIAIVVAIIIVISALALFLIYEKPQGITAMEAIEYSDVYAHEWNEDGELLNMGITDYLADPSYIQNGEEGRYHEWFCFYGVLTNNGENISSISFKVHSNGTVIELNRAEISNLSDYNTYNAGYLSNWTIDSDEAFDIAKENSDVVNWLDQHPDANLITFNINHVDYTAWHIIWVDKSDSNYGQMIIGIVADTGEIIISQT